jgi:hypothetical protein
MGDRAPNEDPVDVRDQDGKPVQHDGPARRHNQPRRPPLLPVFARFRQQPGPMMPR